MRFQKGGKEEKAERKEKERENAGKVALERHINNEGPWYVLYVQYECNTASCGMTFSLFVLFQVDILDDRITEVLPTTIDILHSLYASKSVSSLSFATGLNKIHYGL